MAYQTKLLKSVLKAYGPDSELVAVRWAPSGDATQTLTEAHGVASVTRSGAGAYTVNLSEGCKEIVWAIVREIENDTTDFHFARIESMSAANKTITVSHKSVAFASVASGPSGSDTVDQLEVVALVRRGR